MLSPVSHLVYEGGWIPHLDNPGGSQKVSGGAAAPRFLRLTMKLVGTHH